MPEYCDRCGVEMHVGDWPICPHGRASSAVHQDSVEGGFWAENGFDHPVYFDSKKAHRDALAAKGLQIAAKWAGENDRHLTRMDIPCATTLANAKALLSRTKATRFATDEAYEPVPITVTPITFEKES